jgi:hypothetical protein
MKKPFPRQEKVVFTLPKGEIVLKNPLNRPIFEMQQDWDSKACGMLPRTLGRLGRLGWFFRALAIRVVCDIKGLSFAGASIWASRA